ncbi:hypothetical protein L3Q67_26895 [Saccharothrix sp. AJ9571]|nr:hypothetical protein L3Q67_26895 [Saccharothrix sp. AJ9571]
MTGPTPAGMAGAAGPRQANQRGFIRRNSGVLVIAALLVLVAAVAGTRSAGQRAALDGQESRISELEGELRTAHRARSEQIEGDLLHSVGVSRARLDGDARMIAALVETAFTWDSSAAYDQARAELKAKYGLSEDDVFFTEFMPPSRYNSDAGGQRYHYIDAQGLNSSAGDDLDIEVVRVSAGDYTYAVLADVAVTSDAIEQNNANPGRITAQRRMLLVVTVDAEGGVSGLSGVPASGSTRHSN